MAKTKDEKTSASVYNMHGQLIRTYDLETHGDTFAELAQEFAAHTPGSEVR